MDAKSKNSDEPWLDPDDAPELTEAFFENGIWRIGDRVVTPKEGRAEMGDYLLPPLGNGSKIMDKIIIDADVLTAFKAMGPGWQNVMNDALRAWLAAQADPVSSDTDRTTPIGH